MLLQYLTSARAQKKSLNPSKSFLGLMAPSSASWSAQSIPALVQNAFAGNPVGFRSIKLISEASASISVIAQDQKHRYERHSALDILEAPNKTQGFSSFFEALYGHILLSGNGYIEAVTNEDGEIIALHILRPDRMRIIPGADGWPEFYEYQVGKNKRHFPVDVDFPLLLHVKNFHPRDDHYGLSPLVAASRAVDVHNAASEWSKSLLDNAAQPSGAIVYHGVDGQDSLTPEQYQRLIDELEARHTGARNAGRPMLLEGGLDWKQMGFSPADMEFHKTRDSAARDIALALGVPPMLLGLPGDNTYSNYQEANRAFYRLTVLPFVTRVMSSISQWFTQIGLLDSQTRLLLDLDSVMALSEERETKWRRIGNADFLTQNEKRRLLGFPDLDLDTE